MTPQETLDLLLHEPLSDRIERALSALQEAEAPLSPVKVNMGVWHGYNRGQCFACLGGVAVIDLCDAWDIWPETERDIARHVSSRDTNPLLAAELELAIDRYELSLDSVRKGFLRSALQFARHARNSELFTYQVPNFDVPRYEDDRAGFEASLREMVVYLRSEGF